jgi:acyl dehydratase
VGATVIAITGPDELAGLTGAELGPTTWLTLDREQIVGFDEATFHAPSTNYAGAETAAAAHGTHTLALLPPLFEQTVAVRGFRAVVLGGFDRVRFPAPVPVGGRVRVHFRVEEVSPAGGGHQCRVSATVECEGESKPACVCDMILRLLE